VLDALLLAAIMIQWSAIASKDSSQLTASDTGHYAHGTPGVLEPGRSRWNSL